MIEEIFYLDEGHIKITAASVGISSRRWKASKANGSKYKSLMKVNRFDILPIISNDGKTYEFYKTNKPNNYDNISKHPITYKDVIPLDTSIRDIIKGFATDERTFYFLTYHSRITGLITLGNLNCRQVQVYIFGLICELERILSEFIEVVLTKGQLEDFIIKKSESNKKLQEVWEHYKELIKVDLENKLIEHLYLSDFFNIINHFKHNIILNYSNTQWDDLSGVNDLRHLVAHPTRSLLDKDNDIKRLWKRIGKIEDLTFRLNQWRHFNNRKNGSS